MNYCTCDARFSGVDEAEYCARGCPDCYCLEDFSLSEIEAHIDPDPKKRLTHERYLVKAVMKIHELKGQLQREFNRRTAMSEKCGMQEIVMEDAKTLIKEIQKGVMPMRIFGFKPTISPSEIYDKCDEIMTLLGDDK